MQNDIFDIWEIDAISELVSVPAWIDSDITGAQVAGIVQGGCESGAYMPAVTYHKAIETMTEYSEDIEDFLEENVGDIADVYKMIIDNQVSHCWPVLAVGIVSLAVEVWAGQAEEEIEEILEHDKSIIRNQWPDIKAMIIEQYSADDEPALNEGFNNWTDSLCKEGEISEYTYSNVTWDDVE